MVLLIRGSGLLPCRTDRGVTSRKGRMTPLFGCRTDSQCPRESVVILTKVRQLVARLVQSPLSSSMILLFLARHRISRLRFVLDRGRAPGHTQTFGHVLKDFKETNCKTHNPVTIGSHGQAPAKGKLDQMGYVNQHGNNRKAS